jgi:hypothetical protein
MKRIPCSVPVYYWNSLAAEEAGLLDVTCGSSRKYVLIVSSFVGVLAVIRSLSRIKA